MATPPDFYSLFASPEAEAQQKAQMMAEALRGTQNAAAANRGLSMVASLGQNNLLQGLGQSSARTAQQLAQQAQFGQGQMADAGQQQSARALQKAMAAENRRQELFDESSRRRWQEGRDRERFAQELIQAQILAGQRQRDKAEDRADAAALRAQEKADAARLKQEQGMHELEGRFRNIEERVADVRGMIGNKGTYELLGSHNEVLNSKLNDIATDMAKVMDPESVARESEVEAAKKNLPRVGLRQSNATALAVLKSFEEDLKKRRANAYKVRGLTPPASPAPVVGLNDAEQKRLAELEALEKVGKLK